MTRLLVLAIALAPNLAAAAGCGPLSPPGSAGPAPTITTTSDSQPATTGRVRDVNVLLTPTTPALSSVSIGVHQAPAAGETYPQLEADVITTAKATLRTIMAAGVTFSATQDAGADASGRRILSAIATVNPAVGGNYGIEVRSAVAATGTAFDALPASLTAANACTILTNVFNGL